MNNIVHKIIKEHKGHCRDKITEDKRQHYVYILFDDNFNFYLGLRSTKNFLISSDKYKGSFTSWENIKNIKNFKNKLNKVNLKSFYNRNDAAKYEREIIIKYINNIKCQNKSIPAGIQSKFNKSNFYHKNDLLKNKKIRKIYVLDCDDELVLNGTYIGIMTKTIYDLHIPINKFIQISNESKTNKEAAKKLNLSLQTFIYFSTKLGCYKHRFKFNKDEFLKCYNKYDYIRDIANELNINYITVRRYANKLNLEYKLSSPPKIAHNRKFKNIKKIEFLNICNLLGKKSEMIKYFGRRPFERLSKQFNYTI